MKIIDRSRNYSAVFGLFLIILCVFVWYNTGLYPDHLTDARSAAGPKVFPRILGICLAAGGLYEIAGYFVTGKISSSVEKWRTFFIKPGNWNMFWFIVMTAFFVPLTLFLGFAIGGTIYSTVLMWRYGVKPWLAFIISLAAIVLIQLFFGHVFNVPLPVSKWLAAFGWRY